MTYETMKDDSICSLIRITCVLFVSLTTGNHFGSVLNCERQKKVVRPVPSDRRDVDRPAVPTSLFSPSGWWMISSLSPPVACSWPSFVTWTLLALCVTWPSVTEARPTVEVNENEAGRPNLSRLQRRLGRLYEGCGAPTCLCLLISRAALTVGSS